MARAGSSNMPLDEDVRVDPADGSEFSLSDLFAMHDVLRTGVARQAIEKYWHNVCRATTIYRVDPADGRPYTFEQFARKYAGVYDEALCRDYFRSVMPRVCPTPWWLKPSGSRVSATMGMSGGTVAVPFAAAALWAAGLPEVAACEGDFHACREASPFAVISALKYAVNNLRLAVGALPPKEATRHWGALLGIRRAATALESFSLQPTTEGFTRSVACAKTALGAFHEWLKTQGPVNIDILPGKGIPFLPGGVSCAVAASATQHKVKLATGAEMPLLGFGTWQMLGEEAYQATLAAIRQGYRHIDTAQAYANERQVGRAIRDSGVPRNEIFLSTKLSDFNCFPQARKAIEAQLRELGVDYVDLYMIHNPGNRESTRAAWRDIEALHYEGKIRHVGVSNYGLRELQDLLQYAKVPPVYLQNKMNVYAIGEQRVSGDESVIKFARERGIQVFGYSVNNPWPNVLKPTEDPHVRAVAARHGRTPAQLLLRWALQLGAGVLPKSVSKSRIEENARLFDFEISHADMGLLTGLITLAESAGSYRAPAWVDDVYGLGVLDV